jgi:hypothetical protein
VGCPPRMNQKDLGAEWGARVHRFGGRGGRQDSAGPNPLRF